MGTLVGHIIEAKNAGLSLDAIAKQVSNTYRANYPASTRLVRTLYNAGANRAQLEALWASGYTHKQWLATPGPRTRPAHAQANRQVKPLEQPFVVGGYNLMYPGDRSLGAPAGMTVNCRCTLVGTVRPTSSSPPPASSSSSDPVQAIEAALQTSTFVGPVQEHGMSFPEQLHEVVFQGNRYQYSVATEQALRASLAQIAADQLPAALRARTERIIFTIQPNKDDVFWEQQYGIPGFVSLATGGDKNIVVYRGAVIPRPQLAHEMAHNLARAVYGGNDYTAASDYFQAVASGELPVSAYGKVAPAEDFAEAVRLYVYDKTELQAIAPLRFKVIDRLMKEVGYGG